MKASYVTVLVQNAGHKYTEHTGSAHACLYTTVIMCQRLFLPTVLFCTAKVVESRNSLFFSVTQRFEKAKDSIIKLLRRARWTNHKPIEKPFHILGRGNTLKTKKHLKASLPAPPLCTTSVASAPTAHSFRSSTTCVCDSVSADCWLISTIRSPSHSPGHPCASRICFTRCPPLQSAMVNPNPSAPFTMVTVNSSPPAAPEDAIETLSSSSPASRWVSPGWGCTNVACIGSMKRAVREMYSM